MEYFSLYINIFIIKVDIFAHVDIIVFQISV